MDNNGKKGVFSPNQSVKVTKVYDNSSQEVITITVDRLRLFLHKNVESTKESNAWVAPLGIFVTIFIVLVTSKFKDLLLAHNTWKSIFIISAFFSFLWFIRTAYKAWSTRGERDIDTLVERIKSDEL